METWESVEAIKWWKYLFNSNVYAGIASLALTTSYVWSPSRRSIFVKDVKTNLLEKTYNFLSTLNNLRNFSISLVVAALLDVAHYETLASTVAISSIISFVVPYLLKPSILRRDKSAGVILTDDDLWRPTSDVLVYSSLLYSLGGILSFLYGMPCFGLLHFFTCFGSTMFHLTRETMFFNWDNIGAMSLLYVTCYGIYLSIGVDFVWTCLGSIGMPSGIFLLVYCGMPGIVCDVGCHKRRTCSSKYNFWHTTWHILSAAGTTLSVYFFHKNFPGLEVGGGQMELFPSVPIVLAVAVGCAILTNLIGNIVGAMPLK